jgi:hypothetical protein
MQWAALLGLALTQPEPGGDSLEVRLPVIYGGAKVDQDPPLDVCAGLELPGITHVGEALPCANARPGECADVWSSPQPSSGWDRSGFWETNYGAALAAWSQTEYGEDTAMVITVDSKILATLEAQIVDPMGNERIRGHGMSEQTTVIVAKDCDDVPIFEVHEAKGASPSLEVYDYLTHKGKKTLIAKGAAATIRDNEFYWTDATGNTTIATVRGRRLVVHEKNAGTFAGVEAFGMTYETGVRDTLMNPLMDVHNRWVLMAAMQVRELRNADRNEEGVVEPGPFRLWVVTWAALKYVLLFLAVVTGLHLVYLWVYKPEIFGAEASRLLKKRKNAAEAPAYQPDLGNWWDGFWHRLP